MSETEHDTNEEAPETAADEPGPSDDETDAAEAEEAETGAGEAAKTSQAKTEKEIEKANLALEKEATAHANRISKIMGEDALRLVPCELCWDKTPGFHWPATDAPIGDEQRAAILAAIGEGLAAGPPLQPASGVETCPQCQGNGQLEFPTFVEHTRVQQCPKCLGSGYVNKDTPQENVYTFQQSQGGTNQGGTATTNFDMLDSWGRPIGHPHYGQSPAQVGT